MGLYSDAFWERYDPQESYERGRREALRIQEEKDNPAQVPFDSPEWLEYLCSLVLLREDLRRMVRDGNRDMDPNANYVDGFLSVWDLKVR